MNPPSLFRRGGRDQTRVLRSAEPDARPFGDVAAMLSGDACVLDETFAGRNGVDPEAYADRQELGRMQRSSAAYLERPPRRR